jgi:ferredoxin
MNTMAQPEIDRRACDLCGECLAACPTGALRIAGSRLEIDLERCAYCGDCEEVCPKGAIRLPYQVVVVTKSHT